VTQRAERAERIGAACAAAIRQRLGLAEDVVSGLKT
jgi:hypothetical protein